MPRLLLWGVPLEQRTDNLTQGGHTSRVNELHTVTGATRAVSELSGLTFQCRRLTLGQL